MIDSSTFSSKLWVSCFVILCFASKQVKCQSTKITVSTSEWQALFPRDFIVLDSIAANLNADSLTDYLVVLKKKGEDTLSNTSEEIIKRPLYILLSNPLTKKLVVFKQNSNVVYCYNCGGVMGDPYTGISVDNNSFTINHYGGSSSRWSREITFKYSSIENNWLLSEDKNESFHVSEPEKVELQLKTPKDFGNLLFRNFDIYKD